MIDRLRNELRDSQAASTKMQRRASELEISNEQLSKELDVTQREFETKREQADAPPRRTTCSGVDLVDRLQGLGQDLDCTMNTTADGGRMRDELFATRQLTGNLEEENLRLREELNQEKQRVLELKRRADSKK